MKFKRSKSSSFENLKFPVFEKPLPDPEPLSMDDYYQFVMMMLTTATTVDGKPLRMLEGARPAPLRFLLE